MLRAYGLGNYERFSNKSVELICIGNLNHFVGFMEFYSKERWPFIYGPTEQGTVRSWLIPGGDPGGSIHFLKQGIPPIEYELGFGGKSITLRQGMKLDKLNLEAEERDLNLLSLFKAGELTAVELPNGRLRLIFSTGGFGEESFTKWMSDFVAEMEKLGFERVDLNQENRIGKAALGVEFEIFPENIDEFSKIKRVLITGPAEWMDHMSKIAESEIKKRFSEILVDVTRKDWGGELADHFSASIHIGGKRHTAAFLLKGSSMFREMSPEMLGKRGDQIYRLSQTPAQVLIVQHCHNIGEAVRAQLRAFAIDPKNPRLYCFIDGKDSYRILKAYNSL